VYHKSSPIQYWRKEWGTKENKSKIWLSHDASTGAAAVHKKYVLGKAKE